ncbi:MAG: glutamine-hydrolyzing carbamoyl-phosphate synthase small subunit [Dysgonamonadaceae bacterium]|jgi:carbamoyl-phosphate synthase small subunit|nr:glutamine-hydrolyzing carbamoyl-phosphate synthase small subunit [Dysgonamonadaceae bacterium]
MQKNKPVYLVLEDGTKFFGTSFGDYSFTSGEVVFNTAMVGYPESLTDPSYMGQILVTTYPLIGNYGVPEDSTKDRLSLFFESEKIQVSGLVVSDYSDEHSHWNSRQSLHDWLKTHNIPAIQGIDTRELTKILREKGSMKGKITENPDDAYEMYDPESENQVAKASCKEVITYGNSENRRVVLIDCGVKHNIIRCLLKRNAYVIRVPWDYDFSTVDYDGLFISNGPGNPAHCTPTIERLRKALDGDKPIFGICMGNQLLSMAAGAKTYKLKYGHRSHNQPVRMVGSNKCLITAQNHGYAVDPSGLGSDWAEFFVNMNDGSNEGIRHKTKPFFSAQFHPEAASGATDADFLFDEFIKLL